MRVRFLKDWTFAGREQGIFYMRDFKAGQEVRLTRAQFGRAKAHGVVAYGEGLEQGAAAAEDAATAGRGEKRNAEGD